jgi:hypothetical protein
VQVHEGARLRCEAQRTELRGCRSTSATRCRLEVEDGTDGWARLSVTMEEREMKLRGLGAAHERTRDTRGNVVTQAVLAAGMTCRNIVGAYTTRWQRHADAGCHARESSSAWTQGFRYGRPSNVGTTHECVRREHRHNAQAHERVGVGQRCEGA